MAIFQPKMAPNGQKSQFLYIDPIWLCLTSIQVIGMRLFFYIKELWVDLLNQNSQIAIFQPKMALNGQKSQIFYIDPIWLCLTSIQIIGMRLFFNIKDLRVDLLNETIKMAIFEAKMAQKWSVMAKIPNFFYFDPIWLCLTSIQSIGTHLFFFIKELWVGLLNKNSKNGHFSTKNGP